MHWEVPSSGLRKIQKVWILFAAIFAVHTFLSFQHRHWMRIRDDFPADAVVGETHHHHENQGAIRSSSSSHRPPEIQSEEQRPVMHTFFASLESMSAGMTDSGHRELLAEWHRAWRAAGWDTVVLTLDDAQQHPEYAAVSEILSHHSPNEYDSLCFFRWFAMAVRGGGWMSDYDTFPLQFDARDHWRLPNAGNFTSQKAHVPCLVSGSGLEWDRMAHELVYVCRLQCRCARFASCVESIPILTVPS